MNNLSIEQAVLAALSKKCPADRQAVAQSLARNVADGISYDPSLKGLDAQEIGAAVEEAGGALEYTPIMAALRARRKRAAERLMKVRTEPSASDSDMVCKSFFLQCWDAYRREGDLSRIWMLTITFLSRWLLSKKEYVAQDEKDWCAMKAIERCEGVPEDERPQRVRDTFAEAVVLLVMKKFGRAMASNREKTEGLLDGWRREYTEFSLKRYGKEPDWEPYGPVRNPLIKL